MKRILALFLMALVAQEADAGYGRGGSSGGFRSSGSSYRSSYSSSSYRPSYSRSYSAPTRSYSSTSHTTVVNHGSSGGGGFGSHIGAGLLGYMMGSAGNHQQPIVVQGQPVGASYVPPVGQPAGEVYPQEVVMPTQERSLFSVILWTLFICFSITVIVYMVRNRNDHCDH